MKNKKFLSTFLILIFLTFINNTSSEEFYFETPEIEVFDNGNILKSNKGGKVLTDKKTEIIADKFEYNKTTSILKAEKNAKVIDDINKILIEAEKIEYDKKNSKIIGSKNVKVIDGLNKILIEAEKIEYDKKTSIVTGTKNVKITDKLKNVAIQANKITYFKNQEKVSTKGNSKVFLGNQYEIDSKDLVFVRQDMLVYSDNPSSLTDLKNDNYYTGEKFKYFVDKKIFRGKKIQLTTPDKDKYSFVDGIIDLNSDEIEGKDLEINFHNNLFGNKENEPRLKGTNAYSNPDQTKISKGIFTTCKRRKDDKCPPWTLQAKNVEHDKNKKIIYYKNAWLKIYNVPVLYYPFFFHPDPTVKRQSGFLKPQLGDSETLGASAYTPYFYAIADNRDLTIKPRIFTDNKFSFQTEYRHVTKNTNNILDLSLTQGHKSSTFEKESARSHFFSNTNINLNFEEFDYSDLEIQLQKVSNDTYLKLFKLESPLIQSDSGTLNSFINLDISKEDFDFNTELSVYEKLGSANTDRYEYILPKYTLSKSITTAYDSMGSLSFNSTGSQNIHTTNVVEARVINNLIFESKDSLLDNGIINNFNIMLKNVNTDGKNSSTYKESFSTELLSAFSFASSYPLERKGINFNNKIIPKISLMYSPNHMKNKRDEKIRIGTNNIWSMDRVSGGDSIESGQSLTLGAEYKVTSKKTDSDLLKFDLAGVFRDKVNENISSTSSLGNTSSDLVGSIRFTPNKYFKTNYNFSLDNNLDLIKYNELSADLKVNNFITSFKYLEEKDSVGQESYIKNNTYYKINNSSSVSFGTRKNKKIDLTEYYDLVYEYKNDCLAAALKYKKTFYSDNDVKPTQDLFFSVTITPIWSYESQNVLVKKNLIKSLNTFNF